MENGKGKGKNCKKGKKGKKDKKGKKETNKYMCKNNLITSYY